MSLSGSSTWSIASDTVWGDCEIFRRWGLAKGSRSVGVERCDLRVTAVLVSGDSEMQASVTVTATHPHPRTRVQLGQTLHADHEPRETLFF